MKSRGLSHSGHGLVRSESLMECTPVECWPSAASAFMILRVAFSNPAPNGRVLAGNLTAR